MGTNGTTANATGLAAAIGTALVTVASALGVDLDQTSAVALSGALITILTFVVGRLSNGEASE